MAKTNYQEAATTYARNYLEKLLKEEDWPSASNVKNHFNKHNYENNNDTPSSPQAAH